MISNKWSLILLRILDQVQQESLDRQKSVNKSTPHICNGKNVSFEWVFYILFFYAVLITHKSTFGVYFSNIKSFDKLLEYSVLIQLITL